MKKITTTVLLFFLLFQVRAQQQKLAEIFLGLQYSHTLYDVTKGNNQAAMGLGAQAFFNISNFPLKATLEITGDVNILDDKVGRYRWDGTFDSSMPLIDNVPSMVNVLAGVSYHPINRVYVGIAAGPSFINGDILLAVKPAIGYMSENHRWTSKLSFINVFNRELPAVVFPNHHYKMQDFSSISLTIGLRLCKI